MSTALLFEHDAVHEIDDWEERLPRLGGASVLWIDLESPEEREVEGLAEALALSATSIRLLQDRAARAPHFADFENYLEVTVHVPTEERELTRVACLVSKQWVVTVRDRPLEVLETFRERASGSGDTGHLDGPEFLANLLEWAFESYFDAFEEIDVVLEEIDTRAMSGEVRERDEVLGRLVGARREIGQLRRALAAHREPIMALTRPELEAISSSSSAERFAALRGRLDEAIQAARDSRESVVGSFDVLIATTGHRTNEIMKVLTLVSVLILPGSLLAGVMGMNFRLGLFDDTVYFWVVLVVMATFALATLVLARVRHWI